MAARILILILVTMLAMPVAEATQPAAAGKRFKTVTKTFANNGQIAIPGSGTATPYPVTVHVGRFRRAKLLDVNLSLRNFSHSFPDQVDILLVDPHGRNALVMSDVGGNDNADNLTITLDDEAGAALPLSSQLSSGTFLPTNDGAIDTLPAPAPLSSGNVALSAFNRVNPRGQWLLYVRDDNAGDNGLIAGGWSLEIKMKVKKKRRHR
jgi:hypothetical protein